MSQTSRRIALTDGSGRWFDESKAESYDEARDWNGNNMISRATGSQWEHETLYHTASGKWIMLSESNWQGTLPTYEEVSPARAKKWLAINGYEYPEELEI